MSSDNTVSGDVEIRDMESGDVERIGEIAVAAWRPIYEYYREIMGEDLFAAKYGDWEEYKGSQVKSQCRDRPEAVRVATRDGAVVGFVTFSIDRDASVGEIGNNAVHPDAQGHGIATAMYRHVLREFHDRGLEFAEVTTGLDENHAPARRAYEKVGFDVERPSVTYYREL